MSKSYKEFRMNFITTNMYEKEYISDEDYRNLESKEGYVRDYDKQMNYKRIPSDVTDNELNQFIAIRTLESLEEINSKFSVINEIDEKINTMKGIMIFWVVLTIIGLIITFIKLASL